MGILGWTGLIFIGLIAGGTIIECCRRLAYKEVHIYYHMEPKPNKSAGLPLDREEKFL